MVDDFHSRKEDSGATVTTTGGAVMNEKNEDELYSSSDFSSSFPLTVSGTESESSFLLQLPRTSRRSQIKIKLTQYSLSNLHLTRVLVGREEETKKLQQAVAHLLDKKKNTRYLTCVVGPSGVGKTFLVKKALANVKEMELQSNMIYYVTGKFDTVQRDEPFFGLQSSLVDLCNQIIDSSTDQPSEKSLPQLLVNGIDAQSLMVLSNVIPILVDVVGVDNLRRTSEEEETQDTSRLPGTSTTTTTRTEQSVAKQADRLKFSMRRFVQIVTSYRPLVWVWDDVQWADDASMDLLKSILSDDSISNLLVVTCYRQEVPASRLNHPFEERVLEPIKEWQTSGRNIELSTVSVDRLNEDQVLAMISIILSTETSDEETIELSRLVNKRTGGNAFYITQFMRGLVMDGLMKYDTGQMIWSWNIDRIRSESAATLNVVDFVKTKLQEAKSGGHLLLAACLGSTFSSTILRAVCKGFADNFADRFVLLIGSQPKPLDDSSLVEWEEYGFIEMIEEDKYSFVHDKIQESALSFVSVDDLSKVRYTVGYILFQDFQDNQKDSKLLFMVAELLQSAPDLLPDDSDEKLKIAKLNKNAGRMAVKRSAFQTALSFYENAIKLLPADRWNLVPQLSVELYSSAAECAYATGNFESLRSYGKTVMQAPVPILEKMAVVYVMMDADLADSITDSNIVSCRLE